jgi:hypothetical protein
MMSTSPFAARQPVPSRRRPRREDVVTYRVRINLDGVEPSIWRLVDLASDLTLPRLHRVLQAAMGWTDSHLHEFASGESPMDELAEHYRDSDSIDEGLQGVDEMAVRLDEVLVDPGDRLFYVYDFGDNWEHTLELEEVLQRDAADAAAKCLAGARACPPEDCGGIWGYHELLAAFSAPDAENEELLTWAGPEFDPDRFDLAGVNAAITDADERYELDHRVRTSVDPASPLGDLIARFDYLPRDLAHAVAASLGPIAEPDADVMAAMLRPYLWFLARVGEAGITLTQAGYLPPAVVEAVSDVLALDDIWIGKSNRESQTYPVLDFRESVQRLGLIRKARNRLSLTKAGARAGTDVEVLWRHVSAALPLALTTRGPEVRASRDAGLLLLVGVAAGLPEADREALVATGLRELGWRPGPLTVLSSRDVHELQRPTRGVLGNIGAIAPTRYPGSAPFAAPPAAAVTAFARAALGL